MSQIESAEQKIKKYQQAAITNISKNGMLLEYIEQQTPEMCFSAVRATPLALRHVKQCASEEIYMQICITAIETIFADRSTDYTTQAFSDDSVRSEAYIDMHKCINNSFLSQENYFKVLQTLKIIDTLAKRR